MPNEDKIINDNNLRRRPTERGGAFDRKFWLLIVVMIAVIAVGGIFFS